MYHEDYHPISKSALEFMLNNKSYSQEERELIVAGVEKANKEMIRKVRIDLPSGEFVEFDNGIPIGGRADGV